MSRNDDWAYYDQQFRLAREHSKCTWTTIRVDLQLTAQTSKKFRKYTAPTIRKGYCFRYHAKETKCSFNAQCKYKHDCPICNGKHPMFTCNNREGERPAATSHLQHKSPSPVRVDILKKLLTGYKYEDYIVKGFTVGFRLGFKGKQCPSRVTIQSQL